MLISKAIEELVLATKAAGRSKRTSDGYERNLRYFAEFVGDREVSAITTSDLRRYAVSLQNRTQRYEQHPMTSSQDGGLARDSVISYLRSVKRLFNWLADEQMIQSNPAAGLQLPRSIEREPKAYEVDDFVRLLIATSGDTPIKVRDRAILLLLADTGCRVGGLTRLRLSDLDLKEYTVSLTEKGERRRVVPFSATTAEVLQNWLRVRPATEEDWLFINLGRRMRELRLNEEAVGEMLRRLKRRAKVSGRVNPHSFRHGFAREWLRAGGDLSTLARMLGHSDPSITLRFYARFQEEELGEFHKRFSPVVRLYGEDME